ncbi:MAG: hypothetical protein JO265_12900, partial [Acidimicrobiia bacterium]|nr:hypothetical protein [Acidimicrobiia bacterium]
MWQHEAVAVAADVEATSLAGRRLGTVRREQWVLAALIILWIGVFGRLVLLRQDRYGSFSL